VLDSNHAGNTGTDVVGTSGASGSAGVGSAGSGSNPGQDPDAGPGDPDASQGGGGASGAAGSSSGGAAGTGIAGASGIAGAGGYSGSTGIAGSSGISGAGGLGNTECGLDLCVPTVPNGWQGPIAVSRGGAASCPVGYPYYFGDVNQNLQPGATNCSCGCFINQAACVLVSSDTGTNIHPVQCESGFTDDDCITVLPDVTCATTHTENISPSTWGTVERTCGNAVSTGTCTGGSCYPSSGNFGLCISQAGDVQCPSEFPARSLYFTSIDDRRSCLPCTCELQGDQACHAQMEICGVGDYTVDLDTYTEPQTCLPGDGSGWSVINGPSVVDPGNCDAYGGADTTKTATPTGPVTVCCL
jgi:hypothetical protein